MGLLDERYIQGTTRALVDAGIVKTAKIEVVAKLAELKLRQKFTKTANPMAADASAQELNQVTQSGLTENDIQSAAKVVQVIAEMKQTADAAAMGVPQMPGQQGQAPMGQPPLPPPPAGAPGMGGMGGGMPGAMPPGAGPMPGMM